MKKLHEIIGTFLLTKEVTTESEEVLGKHPEYVDIVNMIVEDGEDEHKGKSVLTIEFWQFANQDLLELQLVGEDEDDLIKQFHLTFYPANELEHQTHLAEIKDTIYANLPNARVEVISSRVKPVDVGRQKHIIHANINGWDIIGVGYNYLEAIDKILESSDADGDETISASKVYVGNK